MTGRDVGHARQLLVAVEQKVLAVLRILALEEIVARLPRIQLEHILLLVGFRALEALDAVVAVDARTLRVLQDAVGDGDLAEEALGLAVGLDPRPAGARRPAQLRGVALEQHAVVGGPQPRGVCADRHRQQLVQVAAVQLLDRLLLLGVVLRVLLGVALRRAGAAGLRRPRRRRPAPRGAWPRCRSWTRP